MYERFTPEARRSLELASGLANERGEAAIGPEHLLVALADPATGLGAALLAEAGVDRQAVAAVLAAPTGGSGPAAPPLSDGAKLAVEMAKREALNLAHGHVGSGHLLLGLLRMGEGAAAAFLAGHGVGLEPMRVAVRQRSEGPRLGGRSGPRRTGRIIEAPTPHEQARADAVAEPEDGPVELHLGAGAVLLVGAGARAAYLRALLSAADHVEAADDPDGTMRAELAALGEVLWVALERWLVVDQPGAILPHDPR